MGTKLKESGESFEKMLEELEKILGELENAQTPLESLVERYERAQKYLFACRRKLDEAELKVKKLTQNGEENFTLENE